MPRLNPLLDSLATYPAFEMERIKGELLRSGRTIYDFGTGDPVEPTPEFIRQALLQAVEPECPYPSVMGRKSVRKAIADYMARRFGVTLNPDTQVMPTAGSKEAVFHTPLLVIDPAAEDRLVVVPDPGYPAYQRGALFAGAEAYGVPLTGDHIFRPWLLPTDVLKRTRMLWINNPHNPSGAVTPKDDLRRIADLCVEHNILCVADETYADIYQDVVPHSLLEVGMTNLLVLHSLSKRSGMTGYRTGFLAGDALVMEKLKHLRSNPGLAAQDFVNAAAEAAWGDDSHVVARRKVFADKKQLFLDFFREKGVAVEASEATIYLWIKVPHGHTDESYVAALLQHGVLLSPGRMFAVGEAGREYVRLALVPSMEQCKAAIEIWRHVD